MIITNVSWWKVANTFLGGYLWLCLCPSTLFLFSDLKPPCFSPCSLTRPLVSKTLECFAKPVDSGRLTPNLFTLLVSTVLSYGLGIFSRSLSFSRSSLSLPSQFSFYPQTHSINLLTVISRAASVSLNAAATGLPYFAGQRHETHNANSIAEAALLTRFF